MVTTCSSSEESKICEGVSACTTYVPVVVSFYLLLTCTTALESVIHKGVTAMHFPFRSILELGAGLGFTGIALCLLCHPSRYTFTDCHDDVLHVLKENVGFNLSG